MKVPEVPQWLAQLLGENHPAVKSFEQFVRESDDPDRPDQWDESPHMIMVLVMSMWVDKLPKRARAIIAQDIIGDLIGLRWESDLQVMEHDLVHPDKEVA